MNLFKLIISFTLFGLLFSCDEKIQEKKSSLTIKELQDTLTIINKELMKSEDHIISKYVERKSEEFIKSETGLRYLVYHRGRGENFAKAGKYATISYKITLLNGELCYESKPGKNKEFLIEGDDIESGIHEGIKYMRVGDKAKLIIPSYMAHGLLGDMNKIPPRSPIVYDLELLRLR